MFFNKLAESAFEIALKAISVFGHIGKVAKEITVTVKVKNLVEPNDPLRKLSLSAEKVWIDLFYDKKRCQMDGLPINATLDLLVSIVSDGKKLTVKVESPYLGDSTPSTEIGEAFKEFIQEANQIIDEGFGRDRSLTIDGVLGKEVKTKQVLKLSKFFEVRLSKVFFAIMVKKFVAEVSKNN
jgi:hypothetical protein